MKINKKIIIYILITALVIVAGGVIWWYVSKNQSASNLSIGEQTLEDFFSSSTQKGEFDYTSDNSSNETGVYWVKDNLFRIDYYKADGIKRISILSNDGKNAYFCRPDKSVCEPAVGSVDQYLSTYKKPDGELKKEGYNSEKKCDDYKYIIKKTVDNKGSANGWYYQDRTYCVSSDTIKYVTSRGGIPDREIGTTELKLTKLELGLEINKSTFDLPYAVQNAEVDYR